MPRESFEVRVADDGRFGIGSLVQDYVSFCRVVEGDFAAVFLVVEGGGEDEVAETGFGDAEGFEVCAVFGTSNGFVKCEGGV